MEKRGETKGQWTYLRSGVYGLVGALLFFGLLLLAAGLADRHGAIMDARIPLTKGCMLLSAFLCSTAAAKRAGQGKLQHVLCAEGALMIVLAIAKLTLRSELHLLSIAVDLLLVLFGTFAGMMLRGKQHRKRRGNRHYRA